MLDNRDRLRLLELLAVLLAVIVHGLFLLFEYLGIEEARPARTRVLRELLGHPQVHCGFRVAIADHFELAGDVIRLVCVNDVSRFDDLWIQKEVRLVARALHQASCILCHCNEALPAKSERYVEVPFVGDEHSALVEARRFL